MTSTLNDLNPLDQPQWIALFDGAMVSTDA
jgi:hypothetical protein